jgi:tellurite resistance protein
MGALQLPDVGADKIRAAVRKVLTKQQEAMPSQTVDPSELIGMLPPGGHLRAGAEEAMKDEADDRDAAEYFQSLLELAYLAASADGLADEERDALAALIEHATGAAIHIDTLCLHFQDLDATVEALGRRERLMRVAANFESERARAEAIGFATLVAIADGVLADDEKEVLVELGGLFSLSSEDVDKVVDRVADNIKKQLD